MADTLAAVLPARTGAFAGGSTDLLAATIPARTGSFTGLTSPSVIGLNADIPARTASITGVTGITGSVDAVLPARTAAFVSQNTVAATLGVPSATFTGVVGQIGSLSAIEAAASASFTGTTQNAGTLEAQVRVVASFTGTGGIVGSMASTLGRVALAASGYSGVIGTAAIVVPVIEADFEGRFNITGTVAVQLPALRFVATGGSAGATSTAYALQMKGLGLSSYTNYGFNSFACIDGVYLGATASGVFALTGATDHGTAIAAVVRAGITDFGAPQLKGLERIWAGYTADGDMQLTVLADNLSYTYDLTQIARTDPHNANVKVGKGMRGRYWQFQMANVDGADFNIDTLEFMPVILGRRHGG